MDRAVNAESMAATGAPLAVQQDLGTLWEHQGVQVRLGWLGPGMYVDAVAKWTLYCWDSRKGCMYSCSWSFVTPAGSEGELRFAHMTASHGGRPSI